MENYVNDRLTDGEAITTFMMHLFALYYEKKMMNNRISSTTSTMILKRLDTISLDSYPPPQKSLRFLDDAVKLTVLSDLTRHT